MRHEITLEDGRVFESCTQKEWADAPGWGLRIDDGEEGVTYCRLKKQEPRTYEGTVRAPARYPRDRVVSVPYDWPEGLAVIVTEKVQG